MVWLQIAVRQIIDFGSCEHDFAMETESKKCILFIVIDVQTIVMLEAFKRISGMEYTRRLEAQVGASTPPLNHLQ